MSTVEAAWRPGEGAFALRRAGGVGAAAGKYAAIFATHLREQLAYLGEVALRTTFLALILYIFLQLWRATYRSQGLAAIGGYTVEQMIWYLAFTESIVLSRPNVNRVVDEEIRSGEIAYSLVRPYGYAGYRLVTYFSESVLRFFTTLAVASGLALLYVGPVALSPVGAAAALGAAALAMALDFVAAFGIALLAFWVENTASIDLIYRRVAMLLGGMLLPLEVFPRGLQEIAAALPFSAMVYGPARLALGGAPEDAWALVTRQLAFLVAGSVVVHMLYRAALRRVNVNGG
jgi:ABC-2 type transport system permease protein